mmetsp:Transcript_67826/g.201844  ORF Transcript_67826/g.201844 Transcript_67826/m.201844 type:complete len:293 (-) Transcript_67826:543-1421(-)
MSRVLFHEMRPPVMPRCHARVAPTTACAPGAPLWAHKPPRSRRPSQDASWALMELTAWQYSEASSATRSCSRAPAPMATALRASSRRSLFRCAGRFRRPGGLMHGRRRSRSPSALAKARSSPACWTMKRCCARLCDSMEEAAVCSVASHAPRTATPRSKSGSLLSFWKIALSFSARSATPPLSVPGAPRESPAAGTSRGMVRPPTPSPQSLTRLSSASSSVSHEKQRLPSGPSASALQAPPPGPAGWSPMPARWRASAEVTCPSTILVRYSVLRPGDGSVHLSSLKASSLSK